MTVMLAVLMAELGNHEQFTCVEVHAPYVTQKRLAVGLDETLMRQSSNLYKKVRQD